MLFSSSCIPLNCWKAKEMYPSDWRKVVILSLSEQTKGAEQNSDLWFASNFSWFCSEFGVLGRWGWLCLWISTAFASLLQRASMKPWLCHCLLSCKLTWNNFTVLFGKSVNNNKSTKTFCRRTEERCFMFGSQAEGLWQLLGVEISSSYKP